MTNPSGRCTSRLKPALQAALCLAFLAAALPAPAQDLGPDVEPTFARAVRSIVQDLVSELPYRVPNGEALAVVAEPGSDESLVRSVAASLRAAGFKVDQAGAPRAVPIRVSAKDGASLGLVRVSAGDYQSERAFGHASWVDRPRAENVILVAGAPRDSAEAAVESARKTLDAQLRARFPALAGNASFERYVTRQSPTTFVAKHAIAGRPSYEAYLLAEPSVDRLASAERCAISTQVRRPWFKSGALALLGTMLWLLYARADFRSGGWRTRRLRLAFGTLFVALSLGLWSLPL